MISPPESKIYGTLKINMWFLPTISVHCDTLKLERIHKIIKKRKQWQILRFNFHEVQTSWDVFLDPSVTALGVNKCFFFPLISTQKNLILHFHQEWINRGHYNCKFDFIIHFNNPLLKWIIIIICNLTWPNL